MFRTWIRFNFVGVLGMIIQLLTLALLHALTTIHYLPLPYWLSKQQSFITSSGMRSGHGRSARAKDSHTQCHKDFSVFTWPPV